MMIHRMIVPVPDPAALWTIEATGDDLDARFHQAPGEQELLPPPMAPVAIASAVVFPREIEGVPRLWMGEQGYRLRFKFIHRLHFTGGIDRALQPVEAAAQGHAFAEARHLRGIGEA